MTVIYSEKDFIKPFIIIYSILFIILLGMMAVISVSIINILEEYAVQSLFQKVAVTGTMLGIISLIIVVPGAIVFLLIYFLSVRGRKLEVTGRGINLGKRVEMVDLSAATEGQSIKSIQKQDLWLSWYNISEILVLDSGLGGRRLEGTALSIYTKDKKRYFKVISSEFIQRFAASVRAEGKAQLLKGVN